MPGKRNPSRRVLSFLAVFIYLFTGPACAGFREGLQDWQCLQGKEYLRDSRGKPKWLTSKELEKRVRERSPWVRPGTLGRSGMRGSVTLELLISEDGKVACLRGRSGHSVALASAIGSVKDWVFEPYRVNGVPKAVIGRLRLDYDFRALD
jgi:hypothetical protein